MLEDKVVLLVGEYLRAYRKAKKLSLRDLSQQCGVPKTTISRYENGADGDIDKYHAICDALGIDFRKLVMQAQLDADASAFMEERHRYPSGPLNDTEGRLLSLFRGVSEQSQKAVIGILEAMPKECEQHG